MPTQALPLLIGSTGEAVRDLQQRLTAVGVGLGPAEHGSFDAETEHAVKVFQEQRGLLSTGVCDRETWAALVEAGYRLGDRLLYLRTPMLRGDDVATLQRRLGALGFDAGRVDGIFGPVTERALSDFERNAGLTTDGVAGPATIEALERLGARSDSLTSVAGVREREVLRHTSRELQGLRIIVGEAGGLDALATSLGRTLHEAGAVVAVLHHPEPSTQAVEANEFAADVYLGLAVADGDRCRAAFYATEGFESSGGRRLAELVVEELRIGAGLPAEPPRGMRLPVLRETRMPAVLCHLGPVDRVVEQSADLSDGLARAVQAWARAPVEA